MSILLNTGSVCHSPARKALCPTETVPFEAQLISAPAQLAIRKIVSCLVNMSNSINSDTINCLDSHGILHSKMEICLY